MNLHREDIDLDLDPDPDAGPDVVGDDEPDEPGSAAEPETAEPEALDEADGRTEPEPEPETPVPGPPEVVEAAQRLEPDGPLLGDADAYRQRWNTIQTGFVDEPMYAVESAGRLLAEVLDELASSFATTRDELVAQWRHGGEISTEDLRLAFQAYRSFFNRVVAT